MKKLRFIILCLAVSICCGVAGQAKRPKLMVVPSDAWCKEHGYTQIFENQGSTEEISDYKAALQGDKNLNNVISKINILMSDRGFPLQDLQQSIKSINNISAEDRLIQSKNNNASIQESPLDRIRRTAKADIILEVDWTLNTIGPKQSITYNLRGLDAYSNKQVAGAQGTGAPSFSSEVAVLLEEAVLNNMDNFTATLQQHFDDILNNGREIVIDIRVFDNAEGIDLEWDCDGYELTEVIDNWLAENTVNHVFNKSDATETMTLYDQVRIPLYKANGMAQDAEGFTRELMRFLRKAPYNIPCKVVNRGLGRCLLILGDK
ncbi:MAG: hypothetical protein IJE42_02550 [Bacteroidaceae bacterium]|nr:hypothetical protein [Bacteroidaceae bacterium]